MINQMTMQEFLNNPDAVIKEAANNGKFAAVNTGEGKAIIISEEEWKIMCEAMQLLINSKKS